MCTYCVANILILNCSYNHKPYANYIRLINFMCMRYVVLISIFVSIRDGVYYMLPITITLPSITIKITFQIFKSITITLPSITFITFYYFVVCIG